MEYPDVKSVSEKSPSGPNSVPPLIDKLKKEKEELQKQLDYTVAMAADNEKIWRHFVEIERILFRTRQLEQLIEELLLEIKVRFQLDEIVLFLSHPDLLNRFFPDIAEEGEPIADGAWILPLRPEITRVLFGEIYQPYLLSCEDIEELGDIFPEALSPLSSGVLIPLCIHQILFGGLFLGSREADRYHPKDGTDLLEQLGIKIALCMDNCLTYEKLNDFAVEDSQTGLLNFFQIHSALESEFRKARRHQKPLSLLIIDLDFFQASSGSVEIAPQVLLHVTDLLNELFSEDTVFMGRYGSNEFLVLLPDTSEEEAGEIALYLSREIRRSPFKHDNTVILIHAVIGTATFKPSMKRASDLLDAACTELYQLKMAGAQARTTD